MLSVWCSRNIALSYDSKVNFLLGEAADERNKSA